jgi:SAM-dependent methyltransferase
MLPTHVQKNREAWTRLSADYYAPGRKTWALPKINWGIWDVPESTVRALGNLEELQGKDAIELGCGTAYFSAWLAKHGAKPVGIDVTPAQLKSAREFQNEFGINFPLLEASAEQVPIKDESFDLALSEYGASIWCDTYVWIPEAARLLRPGGRLVFLRNSTLSMLCAPDADDLSASTELQRSQFGMYRLGWEGQEEFNLPHGAMIDLLHQSGFQLERLIEIEPPADATDKDHGYIDLKWCRRWPCEEIWVARKLA